MAASECHPLDILACNVDGLTPSLSAHSGTVMVFDRNVILTLRLLFLACSSAVAHLQFDFEYPRSGFFRSRLFNSGTSPMSDRKLSKLIHRLQMVIPRPPYNGQSWEFLLRHLFFILDQVAYVLVPVYPWVLAFSEQMTTRRHPQDFELPDFR